MRDRIAAARPGRSLWLLRVIEGTAGAYATRAPDTSSEHQVRKRPQKLLAPETDRGGEPWRTRSQCCRPPASRAVPAPADIAAATGISEGDAESALSSLVQAGLAKEASGRYMLDAPGRDRLTELIDEERGGARQGRNPGPTRSSTRSTPRSRRSSPMAASRRRAQRSQRRRLRRRVIVDRLVALHERFAPLAERWSSRCRACALPGPLRQRDRAAQGRRPLLHRASRSLTATTRSGSSSTRS